MTIYDYDPAFRGSNFVSNQTVNRPDGRADYFNSFEGSVTRRLAGSWSLLAAYTATKYHRWLVGVPQSPNDTYFDFTNRGLSYFLLDKEMPVRQIEVAYYESEERQREVIDRIARNPRIVAAMVPAPEGDQSGVDMVSNTIRAPLVWKYLQENFEPDFAEGPVVFWKRRIRPQR